MEPSGSVQDCNGIAFLTKLNTKEVFQSHSTLVFVIDFVCFISTNDHRLSFYRELKKNIFTFTMCFVGHSAVTNVVMAILTMSERSYS
jgi:hypothetical protein